MQIRVRDAIVPQQSAATFLAGLAPSAGRDHPAGMPWRPGTWCYKKTTAARMLPQNPACLCYVPSLQTRCPGDLLLLSVPCFQGTCIWTGRHHQTPTAQKFRRSAAWTATEAGSAVCRGANTSMSHQPPCPLQTAAACWWPRETSWCLWALISI